MPPSLTAADDAKRRRFTQYISARQNSRLIKWLSFDYREQSTTINVLSVPEEFIKGRAIFVLSLFQWLE
jgi:hypothetical protein